MHIGSVTTLEEREGAVIGSAVNFVGRLAAQAPVDSLLLTPRARKNLGHLLREDRVSAETRVAYVPGEKPIRAYELRLDALSTSPKPIIRFAPPTDLLLFLAAQPEELFHVTPRRFEELMAELLGDFGYEVQLTKQTRDDGIDIIAIGRSTPLGLDERYLIQCKRNARQNRVGVSVVRDLLGVGSLEPNTGLMLVTTSAFSDSAKKLALKEFVRWRLHLRDYDHISEWLRAYARRRRE